MSFSQTTSTALDIKEVTLERFVVRSKCGLNGQVAHDLKYVEYLDDILGRLTCELATCIWAVEGQSEERSLSYPDGCWQMFKQTYFPAWLKRVSPVRFTKSTWRVRRLDAFPDLDKVFPGHHAVIKYMISEPTVSSFTEPKITYSNANNYKNNQRSLCQ